MVIRPASASCSSRLPENDRTGRGAFQPQQALSWPRLQSLAARTCSAPPPGLIFRWAPASARDPSYYCPTGTGRWLVSCRGHFDLPRHLVVGHGYWSAVGLPHPTLTRKGGISFCCLASSPMAKLQAQRQSRGVCHAHSHRTGLFFFGATGLFSPNSFF